MLKTTGLLIISVVVLFLSFPNMGNAADLKQGAVVCTSEHLLDLYREITFVDGEVRIIKVGEQE